MATNEEMVTEFSLFRDVWLFFKRYYEVQDSDSYWEAVIEESDLLAKKYQGSQLCRDLIFAIADELDRKHKELRKMPQNIV